jgi:hypothetical protein
MNYYVDIIQQSRLFTSTSRVFDMNMLEPFTRGAVNQIIADAQTAYGVKLMVFETYRSQQRQEMLYQQGATQLKSVGVHHFGLACDLVKDIDGEPNWKGDFSFLGMLAHKHGLIWGGDWGQPAVRHSFVDMDHVQRCSVLDQAKLFAGSWYPDLNYDPTRAVSV